MRHSSDTRIPAPDLSVDFTYIPADKRGTSSFPSLDYSSRNAVLQKAFIDDEKFSHRNNEQLYTYLENMPEEQFTYLVRMAVASKPDSKNPKSETRCLLYKMAEQSGLKLEDIETGQREKTDKRHANQLVKMSRLKKQMQKITS